MSTPDPRGIYQARATVQGRPACYALTSAGVVPPDGWRVVWDEEGRAQTIADLAALLEAADPRRVRPTYLRLVRGRRPDVDAPHGTSRWLLA